MKLDIGSGDKQATGDGWTYVDAYYDDGNTVRAWAWDLPWPDDAADEIRASHCLEHIPRTMTKRTLGEWRRVLCPGGLITIEVPDMDYMARYWLESVNLEWGEEMIYAAGGNMGNFHKTAWNRTRLEQALYGTGFRDILIRAVWSHNMQALEAQGWK